jgi:hypothetical protein
MSESVSQDESVFRLVYRSHMRIPPEQRKAELGTIFSAARSNNKKHGVTGALLVWEEQFVQMLEGDEDAVRSLYDTIKHDPRHERLAVVSTAQVGERVFGRWSMARVTEDGEPDIPLLMNKDKGGISPAAGRPTTPEQDALLDELRTLAREDG